MSLVARERLNAEQRRNRRLRNIAIGVAVAGVALMFYAITIIKMASGIHEIVSPR